MTAHSAGTPTTLPTPPARCIVAHCCQRPFESPQPFLPEYENDGDENTKTNVVRGAAAHDPSARRLTLPFPLCATILVTASRTPPLLFSAAARPMAPPSMCQAFSV
ncbi:unnamed protein product [Ixodes pacificus]